MSDGPKLVAVGKSDADLAAEFKARVAETLKPVCEVMAEASRAGLSVQFDAISLDSFGRYNVSNLRVVKVFA